MNVEDITLQHILSAHQHMKRDVPNLFYETPVAGGMEKRLEGKIPSVKSLAFKLESVQNTGTD